MFFLVVFNGESGMFSCWSNNRFMEDQLEGKMVISCHDTQEEAIEKAEQHNRILKGE